MTERAKDAGVMMFASGHVDDKRAMHEAASAVVGMFEDACAKAIPEDAPTKDALEDEEAIADTQRAPNNKDDPVLLAVQDIARRHEMNVDEVAQAYVVVRMNVDEDEKAAIVVDALADAWDDARGSIGMTFRAFAEEMIATSKDLHTAKHRRVLVPNQQQLVDARGKVIPFKRGEKKPRAFVRGATVVVEGNVPVPDPGPEADYSGTPNEEMSAQILAGKSAYHLDTLDTLEDEAKEAAEAVDEMVRKDWERASNHPAGRTSSDRSDAARKPAVSVLLGMTALVAGLSFNEDTRHAPEEPPTKPGHRRAVRRVQARPTPMGPKPIAGACNGAACRTLDVCLCDCRKCRAGCPRKA